jgi:hypothetical protein
MIATRHPDREWQLDPRSRKKSDQLSRNFAGNEARMRFGAQLPLIPKGLEQTGNAHFCRAL